MRRRWLCWTVCRGLAILLAVGVGSTRASAGPRLRTAPPNDDLAARRSTIIARELAARAEVILGEVLVRWRGRRRAGLGSIGGQRIAGRQPIDARSELLRIGDRTVLSTASLLAGLRARADVEIAEPHRRRRIYRKPTDPRYPLQWHLPRVDLEAAWDITTGARGVVVAVVDTGIRPAHPDLAGRLLRGYDFIADPTNGGDGDGRDADPTDTGKRLVTSSMIHGTHVAGIIGATTNNGIGVAGVDWRCRLLPLRALGVDQGNGADADIVAAIRWAAGLRVEGLPLNPTPARVINLSFGGPGEGKLLTATVEEVIRRGVVVVAAAGNDSRDVRDIYPASIPGVITVAASGYDKKLAYYSNFGAAVDVTAPGGNLAKTLPSKRGGRPVKAGILSTIYDDTDRTFGYEPYEGTSQAAPVVSGIVSLMIAVDPTLRPAGVRDILRATAAASGRCQKGCGAGRVDAAAAIRRTQARRRLSAAGSRGPADPPTIRGYGCAFDPAPQRPGSGALVGLLALVWWARRRHRLAKK